MGLRNVSRLGSLQIKLKLFCMNLWSNNKFNLHLGTLHNYLDILKKYPILKLT